MAHGVNSNLCFDPHRTHYYQGPLQNIHVTPGQAYSVSAWVKLLNDHAGQNIEVEVDFEFSGQYTYCCGGYQHKILQVWSL